MRWLRPLFRRSAADREMDAELRLHYDRIVEDFRMQGRLPRRALDLRRLP
jgi:hypothetical protein